MNTGKDAFEARLARIDNAGYVPIRQSMEAQRETPTPTKSRGAFLGIAVMAVAAVGIAMIGLPALNTIKSELAMMEQSFEPPADTPKIQIDERVASPVVATQTATPPKETPRSAAQARLASALEAAQKTTLSRPSGPKTVKAPVQNLTHAKAFMPPAPMGWITVTPEDSPTTMGSGGTQAERDKVGENHKRAIQSALDRIASRYPGGRSAFEQDDRFRDVQTYVSSLPMVRAVHGDQPNKVRFYYFHPRSEAKLKLELRFLTPSKQLGAPDDDPRVWGDAIVNRLSKSYGSKGVPTKYLGFHGGVSYMDSTTLTEVSYATMGSALEGYNMVLALNHGAEVKINGYMKPDHMRRFLHGFDFDALAARVEAMGN